MEYIYYCFRSSIGVFKIAPRADLWFIRLGDENLGRYASPQVALAELIGGNVYFPDGIEPADCSVPNDLNEWEIICMS